MSNKFYRLFNTTVLLAIILQNSLLCQQCESLNIIHRSGLHHVHGFVGGEKRSTFGISPRSRNVLISCADKANTPSGDTPSGDQEEIEKNTSRTREYPLLSELWNGLRQSFISLVHKIQSSDDAIFLLSLSERGDNNDGLLKAEDHSFPVESLQGHSMNLTQESRWAHAANSIDLSGKWKPIVNSEFKKSYNEYLKNCSQSAIFRNVIVSALPLTVDVIDQKGSNLTLISKSPAGSWARTLVSSGKLFDKGDDNHFFEPVHVEIIDPDKDTVHVESWWEGLGKIHHSIMRGKPRVHGGVFETLRYLENGLLITESFFHPPQNKSSFQPGYIKWKYERVH